MSFFDTITATWVLVWVVVFRRTPCTYRKMTRVAATASIKATMTAMLRDFISSPRFLCSRDESTLELDSLEPEVLTGVADPAARIVGESQPDGVETVRVRVL